MISEKNTSTIFKDYSFSCEKYEINLSSGTASSATFTSGGSAKAPLAWGTEADPTEYYYAAYTSKTGIGFMAGSEEYFTMDVPGTQIYSSGNITNNFYIPMIGKGTSLNNLVFSPACSLLKVRLKDLANAHETVTSIELDNSDIINRPGGEVVLFLLRSGKHKVEGPYKHAANREKVTLFEINEEITTSEKNFYMVIRPNVQGSFTLTINTTDTLMGSHQYTYNMGSITTPTVAGTIYKTSAIDINTLR